MSLPAPISDPLEQLLHRCHRDELQPLARMAGVNPQLGLSDLARNTARFARLRASHGIGNLRRGEGLPYHELLARAAATLGVPVQTEPEQTEALVLARWFAKRWEGQGLDARRVLWARLGLAGEPPERGDQAANEAERQLGRGFGYRVSQLTEPLRRSLGWLAVVFGLTPLGCLLRPLLLPLAAWWFLQPNPERVVETVVEVARLRQIVTRRVTIGIVGSPSSGKDAAIKALFGIDSGNISPVAGSTREVSIQQLPGATALYVVNTPGMGDVVEAVTEEARQVLNHIDLYLYVVNAEGGVQAREKADYDRCVATGKPVLAVVNKVDVLRPRDKERYLDDARAKLGARAEDFQACAFDPLPQLSPTPINREGVHRWIAEKLALSGKDPSELPPLPQAPPSSG
ncbi:MAG TPA: 50S ribosome-binding GTPase [Myxococcota bacterium]|nr:50S ribosome-binding GTPase [Myxococcota bacterium]